MSDPGDADLVLSEGLAVGLPRLDRKLVWLRVGWMTTAQPLPSNFADPASYSVVRRCLRPRTAKAAVRAMMGGPEPRFGHEKPSRGGSW